MSWLRKLVWKFSTHRKKTVKWSNLQINAALFSCSLYVGDVGHWCSEYLNPWWGWWSALASAHWCLLVFLCSVPGTKFDRSSFRFKPVLRWSTKILFYFSILSVCLEFDCLRFSRNIHSFHVSVVSIHPFSEPVLSFTGHRAARAEPDYCWAKAGCTLDRLQVCVVVHSHQTR